MKIKSPGLPLSSGAESLEPLDPRELRGTHKSERFAAALSQMEAQAAGTNKAQSATRAALGQIADNSDLSTEAGALAAVKASARFMVSSRLSERHRNSEEGEQAIEEISEYVAADPLLRGKCLSLLNRVKAH